MKVLIIGDFCYPNYMGGSSKHVFDLIYQFSKIEDIHFKLLTRCKDNGMYSADEPEAQYIFDKLKEECKIVELHINQIFNPLKYFSVIKEADFVILQHPVMGLMGGIVGKLLKKKIIYHYHGPIHEEYRLKSGKQGIRYKILWLFQKITIMCSDKVLTHSDYMKRIALKEHSLPLSKSFYLPPYIEKHPDNQTCLNFFKNDNKTKLLIPRRLTARTGIVEFLNTFLSLRKSDRDRFDIYISGKGELQETIENLVKKDSENLRYIGFLSYDELWSMYHKIDSVVVPTIDLEGFGYIILESLSCGSSAIVSKTCGGGFEFVTKYLGSDHIFDVYSADSVLKALNTIEAKKNNRNDNLKIADKFTTKAMINHYISYILK